MTKQVFYEGRVQGVGFRWTVKSLAKGFDVSGAVKNLPDGRVHLLAQGELEEVTDFLDTIRGSTLAGHIEREEISDMPEADPVRGFQIVE